MKYERVTSNYGLRNQRQRKFNVDESQPERKRKVRRGLAGVRGGLKKNAVSVSCFSTEPAESREV